MPRTSLRLGAYAALLVALFSGGWAVGEQFPTEPTRSTDHTDHGDDADHTDAEQEDTP